MSKRSGKRSLREHLPFVPRIEQHFRWRGENVSRVEGLTDSVFAFAVTLLVVSLEAPTTYEGLIDVLRGLPALVICFAILMLFWNAHFRFHRRYGFEDVFSRLMTMCLIVLVLFFVYPLKFLFTMLTVGLFGLELHNAPTLQTREQAVQLYVIYGIGFAGVYLVYTAMYWHALRKREQLQLTKVELLVTRASLVENLIYVAVCALSIVLAVTTSSAWLPGVVYFLLAPAQGLAGWWYGRQADTLAPQSATAG